MQKINFNLLPFANYGDLTDEAVCEINELFDKIKDNEDDILVPNEFYTCADETGKTFYEYIGEVKDSVSQLLMYTICQNKSIDSKYEDLFIETMNAFEGYIAHERKVAPDSVQEYLVCESCDLPNVYRNFSKRLNTYSEYYLWRSRCFPELLFTKDAFDDAEQIGTFRAKVDEVTACLGCLNDKGKEAYSKYEEQEALAALQAICGIVCTGKGSNEKTTFKKEVEIISPDRKKYVYNISCIPHFKLESRYSDKRVHFCWGQEQINNHSIIVVHIGRHWSSFNERLSVIEGAKYTPSQT